MNNNGNRNLFVANIPWSTDEARLARAFSKFGTVLSTRVIRDKDGFRSKRYASSK